MHEPGSGIGGDDTAIFDGHEELEAGVEGRMPRIDGQDLVAGQSCRASDGEEDVGRHAAILTEGSATWPASPTAAAASTLPKVSSGPQPPRLSVGIVGAGRAGAVLGAALRRAGHHIVAVSAVSDLSRLRAEALLPGVPIMPAPEVAVDAELVLLAVPDDVLPGLVEGLVRTGAVHGGQFVAHPSGRQGIGVLDPATEAGAVPLALHPAMTFTGTSIDLARLEGCPFGVTSEESMRPVAEALVVEMGGEPVWVPESARTMYHAALVFGANYLMTVVLQSIDLLEQAGIAAPERLLAPLLSASLDNALRHGDTALTGPVARGDASTVARHLEVMSDLSPVVTDTYRSLARLTADRAVAAGLIDLPAAEQLLDVLSSPEGLPPREST
jgi:predicted short-subunit dehydrogenase-like oxidoreductase (DUF2520 family)